MNAHQKRSQSGNSQPGGRNRSYGKKHLRRHDVHTTQTQTQREHETKQVKVKTHLGDPELWLVLHDIGEHGAAQEDEVLATRRVLRKERLIAVCVDLWRVASRRVAVCLTTHSCSVPSPDPHLLTQRSLKRRGGEEGTDGQDTPLPRSLDHSTPLTRPLAHSTHSITRSLAGSLVPRCGGGTF